MKIVSSELAIVEALTRSLVLNDEHLEEVAALLMIEFHQGLTRKTHHRAPIKMFPTYVRDVPNGRGEFRGPDGRSWVRTALPARSHVLVTHLLPRH